MHFTHSRHRRGLLFGELSTLPNFHCIIRLTHEEELPVFLVGRVGIQHQNGLLLINATKVEEIAILS